MGRRPDPAVRERIVEQAEHLIHLRGYRATSLDEIARCCGMTKANLFHHFRSKEDLGLAVLEAKAADYTSRQVDPLCECEDPIAAVENMFREAERHFQGNGCRAGCLVANMALEMSDVSERFRERASLFFLDWADRMARCLSRAKQRGLFGPGLDPRAAGEAIVSLYEGAVMLARAHRDHAVLERVGRVAKGILTQHQTEHNNRRK